MRSGLHLLAHKHFSTTHPLREAANPDRVTLTSPRASSAAHALVRAGERVALGQPLVRADAGVIHASVSGSVVSIEAGAKSVVVIDNDGRDSLFDGIHPMSEDMRSEPKALRDAIASAGILGFGGACFPTAEKIHVAVEHHARLLIVNGAECEPFISCDDMLMRERAGEVVLGAALLAKAAGATSTIIAVENDKPEALKAMTEALARRSDGKVRLQPIANYYPAGGENQLIKLLTSREVPSGGVPSDIGVLSQNAGTAAAVARLITTGVPPLSRIVTITGHGVRNPANVEARFGTPIASLIADCGGYVEDIERLIVGGSMMGIALDDDAVVVNAGTNCVIAATRRDLTPRGPEMPCIRCGDCAEACPAALLPQQLLRYAQLHDDAALDELGLKDCIECGCCDYVCPSQIPITVQLRAAKLQAE